MSKSEFRFNAAAILLASALAVFGISEANAVGAAGGTIGTVADKPSQSAAESPAPGSASSALAGSPVADKSPHSVAAGPAESHAQGPVPGGRHCEAGGAHGGAMTPNACK